MGQQDLDNTCGHLHQIFMMMILVTILFGNFPVLTLVITGLTLLGSTLHCHNSQWMTWKYGLCFEEGASNENAVVYLLEIYAGMQQYNATMQ